MKTKKIKISAILYVVILILMFVLAFLIKGIYVDLKNNNSSEIKITDTIETYNYTLNVNDSNYYKILFSDLKEVLSKEKIDKEEYASIISKMFVADFLSLKYSINKNDVGGVMFVHEDYVSDFILSSKDTIYLTVENNIYGDRKQKLPVVKEVKIKKIELDNYEFLDNKEAYFVSLEIEYEEELGYSNNMELIVLESNKMLKIVKVTSL